MNGIVIKNTGANYLVQVGDNIYSCVASGKLRQKGFKSTNPIAIGDIVDITIVSEKEAAIVDIHKRKTSINRKSTNLSRTIQTMAANIDQALFIFTHKNPKTTLVFLDRFLVVAEYNNLPVNIIINKTDICTKDEIEEIAEIATIYNSIGYEVILASVEKKINIEKIKEILTNKSTYVAGLSGVGKSSLINLLIPNLNLKTAEISESHLAGKHTTTFAEMFKLPFGGNIIDSPGVRAFGLTEIKKESLFHYFPEFFETSKFCKYYNCQHLNEPDCAVKIAIEENNISESRYKSYLNMMYDDNNKHRI